MATEEKSGMPQTKLPDPPKTNEDYWLCYVGRLWRQEIYINAHIISGIYPHYQAMNLGIVTPLTNIKYLTE